MLIVFFVLNIALGSVSIPLDQIWKVLIGDQDAKVVWTKIIFFSRFPQILTAILAGTALATAGMLMQTLFKNPLAGPSVLGISSGSSLGVAFVVLMSGQLLGTSLSSYGLIGEIAISIASFAGALGVLLIIIFVSTKLKGNSTLLIIGLMIGYTTNAIVGMLKFYSLEEDVHAYVIWGLGSFAKASYSDIAILTAFVLPGLFLSLLLSKPLNTLNLGENYAKNLGLNVSRMRIYIILTSGFLTAAVTAYCGPIVFLGVAIPHIARNILKTSDHRFLLPINILLGAVVALGCNLIARMPGFDGALPINSITALMGAPVVIWIIFEKKKMNFMG